MGFILNCRGVFTVFSIADGSFFFFLDDDDDDGKNQTAIHYFDILDHWYTECNMIFFS